MLALNDCASHSALLDCQHDLDEILKNHQLRAACCHKRIDLLIIAEHLYRILKRCCQFQNIYVDDIFRRLPIYDHNAGLVE